MMKLEGVKYFLDDIEPIIHFDRDNARRHDTAHIHGTELYASNAVSIARGLPLGRAVRGLD
jgi:hypothetical protein